MKRMKKMEKIVQKVSLKKFIFFLEKETNIIVQQVHKKKLESVKKAQA